MKTSINWLKSYVDFDLDVDSLTHRLTMIGLEVEGLEKVGHSLENIVVAKILSVRPHPSADRLSLCHVDTGRDRVQKQPHGPLAFGRLYRKNARCPQGNCR